MTNDAKRFRERARECRDLAAKAKDPEWRQMLIEIATGLEEEAETEDAENDRAER